MSRHTSESIRIIEQAQIHINQEEINRNDVCSEVHFAYSTKFGLALIAKQSECIVCKISDMESTFQGGKLQNIEEKYVLNRKDMGGVVNFISLSTDSEFVAFHVDNKLRIYHISIFTSKVCNSSMLCVYI